MSLFKSFVKGVTSVGKSILGVAKEYLPTAIGSVLGGPIGGVIGGAVGAAAPAVVSRNKQLVTTTQRAVLPGAGAIAAGLGAAAGFTGAALHASSMNKAVGTLMADGTVRRRRRRRRGISATELKNHARVENFLMKNFKCKTGGTRGTHLRRRAR